MGSVMSIPRDKGYDHTLGLLKETYHFISNRCRRHASDMFETRLMFRKVICMTGEEAAKVFYRPGRFTRKGAMPPTTLRLLQDKGSVQTLDGEAHRHRKEMFMSLMTPESIERLTQITADAWRARAARWERGGEVVLLSEVQEILCRAVCRWVGLELSEEDADGRAREFASMIDGAGSVGPRNWMGMVRRSRTERWIRGAIDAIRGGRLAVDEASAAHAVAWHRELDGELLSTKVAAVELINLLRPTVAVAQYVMFAGLALHEHPECAERLRRNGDDYREWFVQEVRRFYPFFPFVGGRVREAFDWRGHHFEEGAWVLLDFHGTNHDPRVWDEPNQFRPERFAAWNQSPYNFIPQGGGDYYEGHRCPGEWITIELLKTAVEQLTSAMQYRVPEQDLRINMKRMPAMVRSRFVIDSVRRVGAAVEIGQK
ncbi:MAG: cytochrome P450 [Phycisphaerae bacterium]|nr:cytochrome P450 [Phycisphaerae bacterium]